MKRMIAFLLAALMLLSLCACGGGGGVPDSYISTYIANKCYEEDMDASEWDFSTKHNYDAKSHIDTVLVTLTDEGYYGTRSFQIELKYQYNRSSDLWSLFAESEWEDEYAYTYTFNDNILGEWNIDDYGDNIQVTITDIDSTNVTAKCTVSTDVSVLWVGKFNVNMEGSGVYEIEDGGRFKIKTDVPDGYGWQPRIMWECYDYAEVDVSLGINAGVSAHLPGKILMNSD